MRIIIGHSFIRLLLVKERVEDDSTEQKKTSGVGLARPLVDRVSNIAILVSHIPQKYQKSICLPSPARFRKVNTNRNRINLRGEKEHSSRLLLPNLLTS